MKKSTTVILLILTAALGTWMFLKDDGPQDLGGHFLFDWSARLTESEEIKVDVDAAEVAGIDLKSSTAEISLRRREDGAWEILRGLKDRADESIVRQLLEYRRTARIADIIGRGEIDSGKVSAASIGLDDANAWRVSWLRADGSALATIRAGLSAPGSDTGYVEMQGQKRRPDVYLVRPDLRPILARPLDSFRDPRVAKYSADQVVRMVIHKGEGEVEFSRPTAKEGETAPWVIARPLPNAPAYQERVNELLASVCGSKIKEWIAYEEGGTIAESGDKPLVEVTLFPAGQTAKGASLAFHPDPSDPPKPGHVPKTAICRDVQRKARFKVDWQVVDDLCLAESPDIFRSRKLATVDPRIISTIEVKSTFGESVLVVRVRDKWSSRPLAGGPWSDAAPERIEKLITLLNESEIIAFASNSLTDPAAFALDQPAITITMAAGAHFRLDQLTAMTERNSQSLRIGIVKDGRIFANFAGDPFVYRIGPEIPEGIPQSGLKWRSLALPGFSIRQVVRLKQTVGTAPPLNLRNDIRSFKWTAERAGADATDLLDIGAVEGLATRRGSLTAAAWLDNVGDANKALELPAVSIEVELEGFDGKPERSTLDLAPMPTAAARAPFCYGRLTGIPGPFLIDSRVLTDMSANLLRK